MTNTQIIVLAVFATLMAAVIILVVLSSLRNYKDSNDKALHLLEQQVSQSLTRQDTRMGQLNEQLAAAIQNLTVNLNERLGQTQLLSQQMQKSMTDRLDSAGKTIADLKGQLGQLDRATQNVVQVGSEVKKLQDILQRPTLRGGLGEWSLENLLAEILPREHYTLKHRFAGGAEVDALVHLARGQVAIDAKFPLANFQLMLEQDKDADRARLRRVFLRDVQKRIDEIAEKYILPDEGTLDFALMYIPAENVYYEAIINHHDKEPDVCAYGRRRRVIPVSPNTLYAYLMVVVTGLKGLQIEKNAQAIRSQLGRLVADMLLFASDYGILGKHLGNAKSRYDETAAQLNQLNMRLQQIETQTETQSTEEMTATQ